MITVEEIQKRQLKIVQGLALAHALANKSSGVLDPLQRQMELDRISHMMITAKQMCALAEVPEDTIRVMVDVGLAQGA